MRREEVEKIYDGAVARIRRSKVGRTLRLPALYCRPPAGSPGSPGSPGSRRRPTTSGAISASPKKGVKTPTKRKAAAATPRQYTVGGLMLVFFAARVGQIATKVELAAFLRTMRCKTPDPQPRHLGMQLGLNFLVQGCHHPAAGRVLKRGEYCLLDLTSVHPSHGTMHRAPVHGGALDFGAIKALYDLRCACCGSREGERHFKNAHLITTLERGHCDPRKPLTADNCVPMCNMCNMVYKDRAVINLRGFVVEWETFRKSLIKRAEGEGEREGEETTSGSGSRSRSRIRVLSEGTGGAVRPGRPSRAPQEVEEGHDDEASSTISELSTITDGDGESDDTESVTAAAAPAPARLGKEEKPRGEPASAPTFLGRVVTMLAAPLQCCLCWQGVGGCFRASWWWGGRGRVAAATSDCRGGGSGSSDPPVRRTRVGPFFSGDGPGGASALF
jgi:hypothetical protein